MSMTINPDDAPYENTSGSFWEVGQYKRTVLRIDNGVKLCDDLMAFMKERAMIEEQYSKSLKAWRNKYTKVIEKNSSYHTLESTWSKMLLEADRVAQLHQTIKDSLMRDPHEKVKQYKKENYHSLTLGGFKETKICNDEFTRAQKHWAKYLKKVNDAKKTYFNVCKEERSAQMQENAAKSDATLPPEKVKKLQELVEKKSSDRAKYREKYEQAVRDLKDDTPRYMEDMEKAFDKCQDFEQKRLDFFKEMFYSMHQHIDLPSNPEMQAIYRDLQGTIDQANSTEDLKWWKLNHGPDMAMNWPQFEEYDPERIHVQKSMSRKQGNKASKHVAGVDGIAGAQFTSTYPNNTNNVDTRVSDNRPNSWSDDENNPFQDSGSEGNPFGSVENNAGVAVKALYNYDGQEEDELSFKEGDMLYKLEDEDDQGWCKGKLSTGKVGLYPANYVEAI
uniref:Protein kinase C and casein kinase substrate in neurons protein 2 n=1 Tax=Phallusia mammillata TaxID=59560 RepID=A0A6F9DNS1_9ASCI|nr:protein kinase C and casein kinase substrate in neurons protein 2 [Phallusia mammillata]